LLLLLLLLLLPAGVVAALVFGNVAATMANLPVGDAMQLHDLGTVFSEMGAGGQAHATAGA
jgi:hypothetical protein